MTMITKEEMKRRRHKVIQHWKKEKDSGRTIVDLARECNVTPETYRKYLREVGEDPKGRVFTYECDRSYFRVIDTQEKAYWLGFIYADGNISVSKGNFYNLSITLSEKDEGQLEKLRKALNTNIPIKRRKTTNPHTGKPSKMSRLDIGSKELTSDLASHGCTPKKSLTKKFPSLEEEMYPHFLRGYFDGNGSFIVSKTNYFAIQLASSVYFLQGMMDFLEETLSIRPKKIYHPLNAKSDDWGTWKCVQKEASTLAEYLYEKSTIHLDRKYQKLVDYKKGNIGEG